MPKDKYSINTKSLLIFQNKNFIFKRALTCLLIIGIIFIFFNNDAKAQEQEILSESKLQQSVANQEQDYSEPVTCASRPGIATGEALGIFGNLRNKLEQKGIIPSVTYTTDNFVKLRGVNNDEYIKYIGLLNYSLTLDLEKLKLIPGGTVYVLGQNVHGQNLQSSFIGSIQDISSIDAPALTELAQYWYDQQLLNDKIEVKVGKQDANCDFDALETSADFINSSFTQIPNIPLPSYPSETFGIASFIRPVKQFNLKAGFYKSILEPDASEISDFFGGEGGYFTIVEVGVKPKIKNLPGNYIVGYWYDSSNIKGIEVSPTIREFSGNYGVYTSFEQALYKENNDEDDKQGLFLQGQFGWNPSERNEIARYYGASLTYNGIIPNRNNDIIGIGTAIADLSGKKPEYVIETFYKIQITPWLYFQPDLQYIFNPAISNKDAFIIGFRAFINL